MAASFSRIVRTPMVMRSDGAGGLLVAQDNHTLPSGVSSGQGMYRVDAAGAKTLLNLPYTRVFDVAPDGAIWYAQGDGVFAIETLSAQGTVLTIQQGYTGTPIDGPLDSVPLGFVSLIAAGRDRAYVLVAGDHSLGDHTNAFQQLLLRQGRLRAEHRPGKRRQLRAGELPDLAGSAVVKQDAIGHRHRLIRKLKRRLRTTALGADLVFGMAIELGDCVPRAIHSYAVDRAKTAAADPDSPVPPQAQVIEILPEQHAGGAAWRQKAR
jgi:hypothetical protein